MPNKETTPQQRFVDERLMMRLSHDVARPMAGMLVKLAELIGNIEARDPSDPQLPVLKRELEASMQVFDRLEELMRGLAADKVRIVNEGALVHEVAERLALSERTFSTHAGDRDAGKEAYILTAQKFLQDLKRTEVIL